MADNRPLKEYYPFPQFRPGIESALDDIDANANKKYFVIKGRTGCGKSAIAVALARKWNGNILTATKLLQDQYANTPEFNLEFTVKGKAAYTCSISGGEMGDAPCASRALLKIGQGKYGISEGAPADLRLACVNAKRCEYYEKRAAVAAGAVGGFMNYDFALSNNVTGESIVLDEAHNFIDKMLDFYSLDVSRRRLKALLSISDSPNQTNFVDWLSRVSKIASARYEMASDARTREQVGSIRDRCESIIRQSPLPGDYFVEATDDQLSIKPLKPKLIVRRFLDKFTRVFFLSATIDDNFAAVLGLPPDQTHSMIIEGNFPQELRPIYFPRNIPNINYRTVFADDSPHIRLLTAIIKHHEGQRGIIHTANYRTMTALQAIYGTESRFTWVEQGEDKARLLAAHARSEDSILVSPAMTEGVDLADDLARWQVIFKVPFPARTPYQEALEQSLPGLYEMSTRNSLVQAYGRPVRSSTDWASTYIVDGSLKMVLPSIDTYFAKAVKVGEFEKLITALESDKIPKTLQSQVQNTGAQS